MLTAEIHSARFAHAYLLTGHDPGRLRAAAVLLAQALCCLAKEDGGGPCGACRSCAEIERGVYADLAMDESPRHKLGEVKEQLALLTERPVAGPRRIVVLDGAGNMTREAQNVLLKTLEEPPASSVLILMAESAEGILPTVVSRCRLISIGTASPGELLEMLAERGLTQDLALFAALAAGDDSSQLEALAGREDLDQMRSDAVGFAVGILGPGKIAPLELVDKYQGRLSSGDAALSWLACVGAVLRAVIATAAGDDTTPRGAFAEAEADAIGLMLPLEAAGLVDALQDTRRAIRHHASARLALEAAILATTGQSAKGFD